MNANELTKEVLVINEMILYICDALDDIKKRVNGWDRKCEEEFTQNNIMEEEKKEVVVKEIGVFIKTYLELQVEFMNILQDIYTKI